METSSQPPQPHRTQTKEELDLEIIDLPDISEAANIRHAWLWHTILQLQRAVNPRSWRLIQTFFTLLLALIATLLILSGILHPIASSPVITPDQNEIFASSNPINYDRNPLTVYRGHRGPVRSIAWSPNGELLAACGQDATVQIWDRQTGKLLLVYRGHNRTVTGIAWSPDSTRIVSVSLDTTAQVWDARTGKLLFIYHNHNPVSSIYSVAWSPDSTRIASTSDATMVQVWNATTGQHLITYQNHNDVVSDVQWSPNNLYIASASYDSTVQVWNAQTGKLLFTFLSQASSVAWSPGGSFIATGGTDGLVKLWPIARPTPGGHSVH